MAKSNLTQLLNTRVQVGGAATGFSASAADIDSLLPGEVGVFDKYGVAISAPTKGDDFVIATLTESGKLLKSNVIPGDAKITYRKSDYAPETNQIDAFGFNGTDGSIEEINDNTYMLYFYMVDVINGNHDGQYNKVASYKSDLNATQEEIALGLAESVYYNTIKEVDVPFIAEVLNSAATEVSLSGTGDLAFTKGSTLVGAATDVDAVLSAGDYIRVATGVDQTVYRVETINSADNTLVIDRPYTGESEVISDAVAVSVEASVAQAADFGLLIVGQPAYFINSETGSIKFNHDVIRWDMATENTGASSIKRIQNAYEGRNTIQDVANMEGLLSGNEGETFRKGQPAIFPAMYNVNVNAAGGGYNAISISWVDIQTPGFGAAVVRRSLQVFYPTGVTAYATDLESRLDTIIG